MSLYKNSLIGLAALLQAKGPHERAYLFCAIRTRFLNLNKCENLVVVVNLDDVSSQEWASVSDDLDFVDFHHLEKALTCLRSVEREALFLMTVEGYTAKEVAAFTGQARGTLALLQSKQQVSSDFLVNTWCEGDLFYSLASGL